VNDLLLQLCDCDFICCDYQHTRQRVYQILGVMAFAVVDKCKPTQNWNCWSSMWNWLQSI